MTKRVSTFRLRRAWYICSLFNSGTLKSLSPQRNNVGVVMRWAGRNGKKTSSQSSGSSRGGRSWVPYPGENIWAPWVESIFDDDEPLTAALKRRLEAIT